MTDKRLKKVKWVCPYCPAKGIKWLSLHKARRNGRTHIKRSHNKQEEAKIIIKWDR